MPTMDFVFDSSGARRGAAEIARAAKDVEAATEKAAKSIDRLDSSVREMATAAAEARRAHEAASAGAKRTEESHERARRSVGLLGREYRALIAGVTGVAAFQATTRQIIDFDDAITRLGVISRTSGAELQSLSDLARTLGATTRYTASQAAESLIELAQAGFTVNQQMLAVDDTLNLALLSGLDLGRAADIMSNTIRQFGFSAAEASRVVDSLSAAAFASNTNVFELSEALKFAGAVAASLGQDLETTNAALGVLSDRGIKGALAGTNLRSILVQLAAPQEEAIALFEEYGIELEDVSTQSTSLIDSLYRLRQAHLDVSDVVTIFDRRNAAAALTLIENVDSLAELVDEQRKQTGLGEEAAVKFSNTLVGKFKELKSAIQETALAAGDRGLGFALRGTFEGLTQYARMLNGTSDSSYLAEAAVQQLTLALALVGSTRIVTGINLLTLAWRGLALAFTAHPIGAIVTVATTALAAFAYTADKAAAESRVLAEEQKRLADAARHKPYEEAGSVYGAAFSIFGVNGPFDPDGAEAIDFSKYGAAVRERVELVKAELAKLAPRSALRDSVAGRPITDLADKAAFDLSFGQQVPGLLKTPETQDVIKDGKLVEQTLIETAKNVSSIIEGLRRVGTKDADAAAFEIKKRFFGALENIDISNQLREEISHAAAKGASDAFSDADSFQSYIDGLELGKKAAEEFAKHLATMAEAANEVDASFAEIDKQIELLDRGFTPSQVSDELKIQASVARFAATAIEAYGQDSETARIATVAYEESLRNLTVRLNEATDAEKAASEAKRDAEKASREAARDQERLIEESARYVEQLDEELRRTREDIQLLSVEGEKRHSLRVVMEAQAIAAKTLGADTEIANQRVSELSEALDELADAQRFRELADSIAGSIGNALDDVLEKLYDMELQFKDLQDLSKQLSKEITLGVLSKTVTEPVTDEISNQLFATFKGSSPTTNSALGQQYTQQMSVTAQTVNVIGGGSNATQPLPSVPGGGLPSLPGGGLPSVGSTGTSGSTPPFNYPPDFIGPQLPSDFAGNASTNTPGSITPPSLTPGATGGTQSGFGLGTALGLFGGGLSVFNGVSTAKESSSPLGQVGGGLQALGGIGMLLGLIPGLQALLLPGLLLSLGGGFLGGFGGQNYNGNFIRNRRVTPHYAGDVMNSRFEFTDGYGNTHSGSELEAEAIMPLGRDSRGRLGIRSQGGRGSTTNVTNNFYVKDYDSFRKSATLLRADEDAHRRRAQARH